MEILIATLLLRLNQRSFCSPSSGSRFAEKHKNFLINNLLSFKALTFSLLSLFTINFAYASTCENFFQKPREFFNLDHSARRLEQTQKLKVIEDRELSMGGDWNSGNKLLRINPESIAGSPRAIFAHEVVHSTTDHKISLNPSIENLARAIRFETSGTHTLNDVIGSEVLLSYKSHFQRDEARAHKVQSNVQIAIAKHHLKHKHLVAGMTEVLTVKFLFARSKMFDKASIVLSQIALASLARGEAHVNWKPTILNENVVEGFVSLKAENGAAFFMRIPVYAPRYIRQNPDYILSQIILVLKAAIKDSTRSLEHSEKNPPMTMEQLMQNITSVSNSRG